MAEQPAWCQTVEQVLDSQSSNLQSGLTSDEVQRRRDKYGWNELEKEPATPLWKLVLAQFDDMLVKASRRPVHCSSMLGTVAAWGHGWVWLLTAVWAKRRPLQAF